MKHPERTLEFWKATAIERNRERDEMKRDRNGMLKEVKRLRQWIADLQSGMYINCVYCGHRYGPDPGTPVAMAEVLKQHIERCPEHPMSKMKHALEESVKLQSHYAELLNMHDGGERIGFENAEAWMARLKQLRS